jgi:hypothetical protein
MDKAGPLGIQLKQRLNKDKTAVTVNTIRVKKEK